MKLCTLFAALAATLCAQAPAPPALPQVPPDTVVATVDGKDVTVAQIRKMLDDLGPQFVQAFRTNPSMAIRDFFAIQYLSGEGEKLKLADESPWKEQLESSRANILANAMVNRERDTAGVSPEDIEAFYQHNTARFEQAKIKVISISFKPPIPTGTSPEAVKAAAEAAMAAAHNEHTEDEAKNLAAVVVKQARAGTSFAELVEKYSEDPISKAAKGDFGVVKPTSSYPNDMKKAVFSLKPGEISDPVRQPSAYYVIRCEERSTQPIEEVRETIVQEIRQAHLSEFIRNLQARFTPKIEKPEFFSQPSAAPPKPALPGNPPPAARPAPVPAPSATPAPPAKQ
jgi:hypothetical protein